MRVVIRADAGPRIGSGHVMRCFALAEALRARGAEVVFVAAHVPPRAAQALAAGGVRLREPVAICPAPDDAEALISLAGGAGAVVVDGYHFDAQYLERLRAGGLRVAWLDDVHLLDRFDSDIVLNPTFGAERCRYRAAGHTRVLTGATYALLRRSLAARPAVSPQPRIVITLGGADPQQLTPHVLRAAVEARLNGVEIVAVVGPSNPGIDAVRAAAAGVAGVTVLQDPAGMAELLAASQLAIAAAGTMAWELARLGVPALLLVTADNQEPGAAMMEEAQAADVLRAAEPGRLSALPQQLRALWEDEPRRQRMAARASRVVDGRGAARVADWLLDGARPGTVAMRAAVTADALQVWRINSEPSVRDQSFDPSPIPLAGHFDWYDRQLTSQSAAWFVFERGHEIAAIVRYDRAGDGQSAELGFAVASPFRGLGLGARTLADSWAAACQALQVPVVRGAVITSNAASAAAFRRAGFFEAGRETRHGRDCLVFERRAA